MPVLTLEGACLAFGHHALLDHADLVVEPGDRIALIGRNGTGKSSLVRAVTGEIQLDDGKVWIQPGIRIAHVAQEPPLDPEDTVFEAVAGGLGELRNALVDYHHLSVLLSKHGEATEQGEAAAVARRPFANHRGVVEREAGRLLDGDEIKRRAGESRSENQSEQT